MNNFINQNRVTIPKATVSELELEGSFANLSIQDESLPWYSQSIPKDKSEQTNNADVDVDNNVIPEEDEDIPLETENKSPIPATLFVPKIMSVDESTLTLCLRILCFQKEIMLKKQTFVPEKQTFVPDTLPTENK